MKELRRNMRLVGVILVGAFTALCLWYALTVYTQGSQWASSSLNKRAAQSSARRGDITDRNGVALATTNSDGQRIYVESEAARRALSQTVGDTLGMSGTSVECFHAATLTSVSQSVTGRLGELLSGEAHVGNSIKITIDARLQAYVSTIFPEGYNGCVCIINYKTGEILCMVSKPDYDPQLILTRQEGVADSAYLNRCLQGLYTPGSTFKIVTLAAALSNDPAVINQTFICAGVWEFDTYRVNCASDTAHGTLKLQDAFSKSCNVTFGKLAYQLGGERLLATARQFGFNENFKFGDYIIYNSAFPTDIKSDADLVWSGIGQGKVLTTPLHMAMITGAVANGGTMMQPYLVSEVRAADGTLVKNGAPRAYRDVMSAENAAIIAEYMRAAVTGGTAARAAIPGYAVCGKTGSAEVSDDKEIATNAWYVGYIANPETPYAIAVVIETAGSGGEQAAPVAKLALQKAIELGK